MYVPLVTSSCMISVQSFFKIRQFVKHCREVPYTTTMTLSSLSKGISLNKGVQVYSLEYTDIPKVFFAPHHGRWRQQSDQGNSKGNRGKRGVQGNCCNSVIRGRCCNSGTQSSCICDPRMGWKTRQIRVANPALRKLVGKTLVFLHGVQGLGVA